MKLYPSFDTSIDKLLSLQDNNTQFLSTWNKGRGHLEFPDTIIWPAIKQYSELKNDYFFSDELFEYKHNLLNENCLPLSENQMNNLGIFSNGTSAAMLAIMSIKDAVSSIRSILIAPTYFTYIKVLRDLNSDIYYFPIKIEDAKARLPLDTIKENIMQNKINLVVLTLPLFGTGLSPKKRCIEELCQLCEDLDCYLLIDYLYGGMDWVHHNTIQVKWLWSLCLRHTKIVFIESLSKRVFLNGIKSATVGASADFIHEMELKSVHLVGSLSYAQVTLLRQLYTKENTSFVEARIIKNIEYFQLNYQLLQTLCINTPIRILPCTEGYFCLAEIPTANEEESMEVAIKILKQSNVMTIPHDRYLYFTPQRYTFRINLSIQKDVLLRGISQLLQLYF